MASLFDAVDPAAKDERFDDLLARPGIRIERIVSTGQATAPGLWLEQAWDEWVLQVTGAAVLQVEGGAADRLEPGAYRLIPAGTRHRVEWTDSNGPAVWLAVHLGAPQAG